MVRCIYAVDLYQKHGKSYGFAPIALRGSVLLRIQIQAQPLQTFLSFEPFWNVALKATPYSTIQR